jgi:3-oxoadipate enol-lactonase
VTLAYRSDGEGDTPVLVLSGGLGTTTTMWEPQLPAFTERYRVLRVDHPGHGASPVPDGPVTVERIARALLALLDELGIARASFVGLSLGGMVGQWLGANAADRIDGLVLACTGASLGAPEVFAERAALVRAEGTGVVLDGARERWFTPASRDAPLARIILDELRAMSAEGYAACCEAVGAFDFHAELHRVALPTLVIFGEEDSVTPPDVIDALTSGIPDVRATGIPRAAHLANVEQPDEFSAAVLSHLEERLAA